MASILAVKPGPIARMVLSRLGTPVSMIMAVTKPVCTTVDQMGKAAAAKHNSDALRVPRQVGCWHSNICVSTAGLGWKIKTRMHSYV